jgi:hypothetical protein
MGGQSRRISARDQEVHAGACETRCDVKADATGATGDERRPMRT